MGMGPIWKFTPFMRIMNRKTVTQTKKGKEKEGMEPGVH